MSNYIWKRFWSPRGEQINLSEVGYLLDPDGEFGKIFNPNLVKLDELIEKPYLVLLGEPGMGKTSELMKYREFLVGKHITSEFDILMIDLGAVGSEQTFRKKIVNNDKVSKWINGNHTLYLLLDSFDECLLRVETIAKLLTEELKDWPIERLKIVISCRTGYWPNSFEQKLQNMWKSDPSQNCVYEIAPLRINDVKEAACKENLNIDDFIEKVEQLGVVPMAVKPITLKFLINKFKVSGSIPHSQIDIYQSGCLMLCDEINEERREFGLIGNLDKNRRFIVAARIACATVLCERSTLFKGVDCGELTLEELNIDELLGEEEINGINVQIDHRGLTETLATGLFSARGINRFGWSHRSYAEYLAAWYIVNKKLPVKQIMDLIVYPDEESNTITPQLLHLASWLASLSIDVFREIAKIQPEILLLNDLSTLNDANKITLASYYLESLEYGKPTYLSSGRYWIYSRLNCSGLASLVQPIINNKDRSETSRLEALYISGACNLSEISDDIVNLARDQKEVYHLRSAAAMVVSMMESEQAKAMLLPLAMGEAGKDDDDELKGYGLIAVWPKHITLQQLFSTLTERKNEQLYGAYEKFISEKFVQGLEVQQIPEVLNWIHNKFETGDWKRSGRNHSFEKLISGVIVKAWENIDQPDIRSGLTQVILDKVQNYEYIGKEKLRGENNKIDFNNLNKRRLVLEEMVKILDEQKRDFYYVSTYAPDLFQEEDFLWILDKFGSSDLTEPKQVIWAEVLGIVVEKTKDKIPLYHACQKYAVLSSKFSWLFDAIPLDSDRAKRYRKYYYEKQQQSTNENAMDDKEQQEQLNQLLTYTADNVLAWHNVIEILRYSNKKDEQKSETDTDLSSFYGWRKANEITKERIINAAKNYAENYQPQIGEWFGTTTIDLRVLHIYQALRLIYTNETEWFNEVYTDKWKYWTAVLLTFVNYKNETIDKRLLQMGYQKAPKEFVQFLSAIMDKEYQNHQNIFIIDSINGFIDNSLATVLMERLNKQDDLSEAAFEKILGILVEVKYSLAIKVAEKYVASDKLTNLAPKSIISAFVLISYATKESWGIIWKTIDLQPDFGKKVISKLAVNSLFGFGFLKLLDERQLGQLYIWICRHFPYSEDVNSLTSSEGRLRSSVLEHLKLRGNADACSEMENIIKEFPEMLWLRDLLLKTKDIMRRQTWKPLKIADVFSLIANHEKRLIRSSRQLLDVIIEALGRIQDKLQGETPINILLWNQWIVEKKQKWRPKEENALSDYIKTDLEVELKNRGIILNREVEIKRLQGGEPGQELDIRIDCISTENPSEVFIAYIEIKGSWHDEVKTAMETQLLDRYMKGNGICRQGLYLVGWFNCLQWDHEDSRKRKAKSHGTLEELTKYLSLQAENLSRDGYFISSYVLNIALK